MPIVSSGEIGLIADIEAEYDQTGTENISLFQARDDAGLDAGQVAMTQFYNLSDVVLPTVATNSTSSVSSSSMTINGNVTNAGGGTISERGFYFGSSTNATSNTKYTVSGTTGSFSRSMTGLSGGTTYRTFAFATNEAGTTIGSMVTQATSQPTLSSHIAFSGGGGTHWDPAGTDGSFSASTSWSANSNSYTGYGYTSASNGASHGWSGFYVSGVSTSSTGYQSWTKSGSGSNGGTVYYNGRSPSTGGYAGGYISFSKSGYSGFGMTCAQRNFSYSDIRLKTNIRAVGQSPLGYNLYTWNYIDSKYGEGTFKGVIAQDLPEHARIRDDKGYFVVDYSQLDVELEKI